MPVNIRPLMARVWSMNTVFFYLINIHFNLFFNPFKVVFHMNTGVLQIH